MKGTIRKVGNSQGVIIPKEVLQRLGLSRGDSLELREVEGNIRLVPESADLAEQVRAARIGMEKYRVALRESARRLKICMTSRSPSTAVCLASGMPTHWKPVWHGRSTRRHMAKPISSYSPQPISTPLLETTHSRMETSVPAISRRLRFYINRYVINADNAQVIAFVLDVAAGEIDEEGATRFLRDFSIALNPSP
ncbi:putative addiction module antidote [Rhizobium sp. BK077]|jgi:putative addiction module antidote|nr:putative addiction module antidote [Rhizobium sp. BK112]MBB3370185.1 putative addiction module antidote [Rhizobium sp. BK077]MBB4180655.1 putative addiction module antidote [Rhizobium sp. BK109]MBB4251279.1 putative addiction module antidote [Rhizobium sp. BK008]